MQLTFSSTNFHALCDVLANTDSDLLHIIEAYGYPPLWSRPNTFETLVHIILEQQVSLASAKAALEQLRLKVGDITPQNVLNLSDADMKAAYFSRQKMGYVRALSQEIIHGRLNLQQLAQLPDDAVHEQLIHMRGIGNWTIDIYLIMVLHRPDIFPLAILPSDKRSNNSSSCQKPHPTKTYWQLLTDGNHIARLPPCCCGTSIYQKESKFNV